MNPVVACTLIFDCFKENSASNAFEADEFLIFCLSVIAIVAGIYALSWAIDKIYYFLQKLNRSGKDK